MSGSGDRFAVFVETRGHARAAGYRFLGKPPEQRWWQAYREHTSFEQPTLIVESADGRWRAYLGGIPSVRRDVVGTVIHYAVVLGGPCSDPVDPDGVAALRLIAAWLDDIRGGDVGGGRAGAALDAALPGETVEQLIAGSGDSTWSQLQRQLRHALARLPDVSAGAGEVGSDCDPRPVEGPRAGTNQVEINKVEIDTVGTDTVEVNMVEVDTVEIDDVAVAEAARAEAEDDEDGEPADWMGRLAAVRPATAFRTRVAELLAGTPGRALAPNLVDSPDEIADLADGGSPLAVLVLDEPGLLGERLVHLTPARTPPPGASQKKAPPPATGPASTPAPDRHPPTPHPPTRHHSTRDPNRHLPAMVTTALLALAILALLTWAVLH